MILTEEVAFRVERAAVAWSRAWLADVDGIELAPGLPDHVLAPCHPERPELDFQNRVNGLGPQDAAAVAPIAGWYEERGVRPWFELVPSHGAHDLLAALAAAGAEPVGFHAVVCGSPTGVESGAVDRDVAVHVVDTDDDDAFAAFCRARTAAHELPPEIRERAAGDLRGWRRAPGATLYVARVDGDVAATAALFVTGDGIAYLADGATLPAHRRRGLQAVLIHRRLADAAGAGCDLACSQASFGSASHRNLQRAGLAAGFTKVVLRRGTYRDPHH